MTQWLYQWQTLITGILALIVGGAAIAMTKLQIRQQDRLHDAARRSRFAVAKSKAPLAAIELHEHAKIYASNAEKLVPLVIARADRRFSFKGPVFPPKAEQILDHLVESADDPILVGQVSALYSEQQVMVSRLSDVERPSEHTLTVYDYVLQPVMIDAIAMNLLAFARDDVPIARVKWEDIEASAKRLIRDPEIKARLLEHIANYRERERPVPLALRRHNGGV